MLNTKYVAIYDERNFNYKWFLRNPSLVNDGREPIHAINTSESTIEYNPTGRLLKREDGALAEIYENPIWLQSVLTAINNQNK